MKSGFAAKKMKFFTIPAAACPKTGRKANFGPKSGLGQFVSKLLILEKNFWGQSERAQKMLNFAGLFRSVSQLVQKLWPKKSLDRRLKRKSGPKWTRSGQNSDF